MWHVGVVALMTGEVTNVILNAVLTQLLPLAAIRWLTTRIAPRAQLQPRHAQQTL